MAIFDPKIIFLPFLGLREAEDCKCSSTDARTVSFDANIDYDTLTDRTKNGYVKTKCPSFGNYAQQCTGKVWIWSYSGIRFMVKIFLKSHFDSFFIFLPIFKKDWTKNLREWTKKWGIDLTIGRKKRLTKTTLIPKIISFGKLYTLF